MNGFMSETIYHLSTRVGDLNRAKQVELLYMILKRCAVVIEEEKPNFTCGYHMSYSF